VANLTGLFSSAVNDWSSSTSRHRLPLPPPRRLQLDLDHLHPSIDVELQGGSLKLKEYIELHHIASTEPSLSNAATPVSFPPLHAAPPHRCISAPISLLGALAMGPWCSSYRRWYTARCRSYSSSDHFHRSLFVRNLPLKIL
jgi:hypothetical protein